jgi:hypothetical protein
MGGGRGVATSVAIAVGLTACSLLVDTSDLAGGSASSDASADATIGAPGDGSPALDAGRDDSGDAAKSSCGAVHVFCDDFDQGTLGATWDLLLMGAGPITLDTMLSTSPPRSMRVGVIGAAGDRDSSLKKKVTGGPTFHASADFRHEGTGSTGDVDVITVALDPPPAPFVMYAVTAFMASGQLMGQVKVLRNDGGPEVDIRAALNQSVSSFRRLTVEIATPTQMRILVDGAPVLVKDVPTATGVKATISVGAPFADTVNPLTFNFDDVVIDTP